MKLQVKYAAFAMLAAALLVNMAFAQTTIVSSPFTTSSYDGWENTFSGVWPEEADPPTRTWTENEPKWGVILGQDYMIENSNGGIGSLYDTSGTTYIQDTFLGMNMINKTVEVANQPSIYTLNAILNRYDNDGLGLIFGYQDEDNYFRVSTRAQVTSNGNHEEGVGVQKIVNGVCTEIVTPVSVTYPDAHTDFPIGVNVYEFGETPIFDVTFNGTTVISGISDTDLLPGQYGIYSWCQSGDWGTNVKEVAIASETVNLTHTFVSDGPLDWTEYTMATNANTETLETKYVHPSNFRLDFDNGTIVQDVDNYTWASGVTEPTLANIDFLSPAVVVEDTDSVNWDDYKMQVRMSNGDNDGIGVMVRVQDNNTFYRVNFSNQSMGTTGERAPRGMSIQKCVNGVWSELFRDDQEDPLFVYTDGSTSDPIPFDVSVTVDGSDITVQVIDDPDGTPVTINYPTVTDSTDPITYGSVGLTAWGSGGWAPGLESVYSGYGGDMNAPLVVELVEDIPGDANHDNVVDASDATILAGNWQASNASWEQGDFNGDGYVDASDATILAGNWQAGTSAAVPEPSTFILLLVGLGSLLIWKVKR